ncbi:SGNH/GDSL hydrolase family protein [Algibacter luteus]|jgi:lysophospholipase L1-like esterase|uniref:Lysophospholipase L1 n=1 Tax=Algibacter luteus TaxID=1178825 RepID=A0A1M6ARM0_9FLAO|nr:SGNH/GDSL hydrolase family protein [Algibacter luteus]WJJ97389.1 SGNH/GDSL hydrolase family protein [Algibacter luteus]SHI39164.1 Lysophospholipase L1 [Algibacter luteus]
MKLKLYLICISFSVFWLFGCSSDYEVLPITESTSINTSSEPTEEETNVPESSIVKILSLGDSYTYGTNVCPSCSFPEQLKSQLRLRIESSVTQLKIIAQSRWTTTNLIDAINTDSSSNEYDLVTLLIGVNNQYQRKPFSLYEKEFPLLVNNAIAKANGDKSQVIVISIPDYAYTPLGQGNTLISNDIDKYNNYAENYCMQNNISYLYITDITRQGLVNPALVTFDGLHPSELAYSKFVDRLLPLAIKKLN